MFKEKEYNRFIKSKCFVYTQDRFVLDTDFKLQYNITCKKKYLGNTEKLVKNITRETLFNFIQDFNLKDIVDKSTYDLYINQRCIFGIENKNIQTIFKKELTEKLAFFNINLKNIVVIFKS